VELLRIGPKLWVVNNDRGEPIEMTDDILQAVKIRLELDGIKRRHQAIKLETQRRRLQGLKTANLVKQRRAMSQIIPIDKKRGG
jgi:hypothetical protein